MRDHTVNEFTTKGIAEDSAEDSLKFWREQANRTFSSCDTGQLDASLDWLLCLLFLKPLPLFLQAQTHTSQQFRLERLQASCTG